MMSASSSRTTGFQVGLLFQPAGDDPDENSDTAPAQAPASVPAPAQDQPAPTNGSAVQGVPVDEPWQADLVRQAKEIAGREAARVQASSQAPANADVAIKETDDSGLSLPTPRTVKLSSHEHAPSLPAMPRVEKEDIGGEFLMPSGYWQSLHWTLSSKARYRATLDHRIQTTVNSMNDLARIYLQFICVDVISRKGGVGKTQMAANLASIINQKMPWARAMLCDTNPDTGTTARRAGVQGGMTLEQAYQELENISTYVDVLKHFPQNEYGVACIRSGEDIKNLGSEFVRIHKFFSMLSSIFILDAGTAFDHDLSKAGFGVSDVQLLMTEVNEEGFDLVEAALQTINNPAKVQLKQRHIILVGNKLLPGQPLEKMKEQFHGRVSAIRTIRFSPFLAGLDPVDLDRLEPETLIDFLKIIETMYQLLVNTKTSTEQNELPFQ